MLNILFLIVNGSDQNHGGDESLLGAPAVFATDIFGFKIISSTSKKCLVFLFDTQLCISLSGTAKYIL